MVTKIFIAFIFTLFLVVFIPAYGMREASRQDKALARITNQSAERGAEIYITTCASCHGERGEGVVGPALRNTKLEMEALFKTISFGRLAQGIPMPALGVDMGGPLKKHQIEDVINFIQNWDQELISRAQAKHSEATKSIEEKAKATSSTEEILRGKELYNSFGCAACHGPEGKGAVGPSILGKNKDEVVRLVRSPRSPAMPPFSSKRLSDADLNKIISFLNSLVK